MMDSHSDAAVQEARPRALPERYQHSCNMVQRFRQFDPKEQLVIADAFEKIFNGYLGADRHGEAGVDVYIDDSMHGKMILRPVPRDTSQPEIWDNQIGFVLGVAATAQPPLLRHYHDGAISFPNLESMQAAAIATAKRLGQRAPDFGPAVD